MEKRRGTTAETGAGARLRRRYGILLGIAGCLVVLGLALRPTYLAYVDSQNSQTCQTARFVLLMWYQQGVQAALEKGGRAETLDYHGILQEELDGLPDKYPKIGIRKLTREEVGALDPAETGFVITPDPEATYRIENMCRSGGTDLLTMDPQSHQLDISCNIHGEYNLGFSPFGSP